MRISARRIATGLAGGALAFLLAACGGGGSSQEQSGSPVSSGNTATKQTAPAVTALPQTGGVPNKPVCDIISKDVVQQAVGKNKTVHSVSDVDILAGEQPTLCYYYTDKDKVAGVKIQWATPEDALWSDYYNNPGTTVGGDTVRTQVTGLGDGAYKEAGQIDGTKALGYNVLLKNRGIVLSVYDTSGLSDAAVRDVTKAAIRAINDKL